MSVSIKQFELLEEEAYKRLKDLIGEREYTDEQFTQHLKNLQKSDEEWVLFILDEAKNVQKFFKKSKIYINVIIAVSLISFILSIVVAMFFHDSGYQYFILIGGIVISLLLVLLKNRIIKIDNKYYN